MNARAARIIRKMTKARHGNNIYRHAKAAYAHQPHNDKSVRRAVADGQRTGVEAQ
jgi:hypothetical protein